MCSQSCFRYLCILLLLILLIAGCTQQTAVQEAPSAGYGDWVELEYEVYHRNSTILRGSTAGIIGSGELVSWAEALALGMRVGEVRVGEIPPWEGFGRVNHSLLRWEPRLMLLPRKVVMSRQRFLEEFGEAPEAGEVLRTRLYRLRVVNVSGDRVVAERAAENSSLSSECGNLSITQNSTTIAYFFTPVLNVTCTRGGEFLRYIAMNATHVLVDRNHPLAGKWLKGRLRLKALVKAEAAGDVWLGSMEQALKLAEAEHRPVLAYLGEQPPYPQAWLLGLNRSAVLLRLTPEDAGRLGIESQPAFAVLYGNTTVVLQGTPPPVQLWELLQDVREGER